MKKTGMNVKNKYRQDFNGDQVFDYKDPVSLSRFISDGGKITPARLSKLSISQQKQAAGAVKKARSLALLPNGSDAHDSFHRSEPISPVPFEI
jgi:small subunit ribosomal protein S18